MSCTACTEPPFRTTSLQGNFEQDLLKATFARQTLWSAVIGTALGFMRMGPLGAAVLVGGGAYGLVRVREPDLAEQAPLAQFFWMAAVAAGAVVLERAVIGDA